MIFVSVTNNGQSKAMSPRASPQPNETAPPLGQRLAWFGQALTLAAFWQICGLLTPERASAFGQAVMERIGPGHAKHKRIWRNLRLAFPDNSDAEIDATARGVWGNFGRVLAEYPHLATMARDRDGGPIERVVRDDQAAWRRAGTPAVFVSAHLGNWEFAGCEAVTGEIPLIAIYSPQANPQIDRMIQKKRRALGCELVSKNAGVRDLMRHLEGGHSIGVVADQRVDGGALLPFFDHPASTTTVPARLALRLGLELVPVRIERRDGGRFRVTVFEAVEPRDRSQNPQEQAIDMMRQVNGLFETWIRERPHEWLCSKRRWAKELRPTRTSGKTLVTDQSPG